MTCTLQIRGRRSTWVHRFARSRPTRNQTSTPSVSGGGALDSVYAIDSNGVVREFIEDVKGARA